MSIIALRVHLNANECLPNSFIRDVIRVSKGRAKTSSEKDKESELVELKFSFQQIFVFLVAVIHQHSIDCSKFICFIYTDFNNIVTACLYFMHGTNTFD